MRASDAGAAGLTDWVRRRDRNAFLAGVSELAWKRPDEFGDASHKAVVRSPQHVLPRSRRWSHRAL